jgi:DNA polymerase-1
LIGLSLAAGPSEHWYLSFGHRPEDGELAAPAAVPNLPPLDSPTLASVAAVLADPSVPKAGHNIKYDWQVLRRAGVELAGVAFDSMLASFVLDPGRRTHAIDNLSFEHLSRQLPQLEAPARGRPPRPVAELSQAAVANVSCAQCLAVLGLHAWFTPQLDQLKLTGLLTEIEMPLVPVLADMEWTGIAIDRELFHRLSSELTQELAALERDIAQQSASDLNLNSPKQLAVLLFDKLQLPILKKTKTGPSTDADVLEQLAGLGHEVPRLILEYRELQKLKSTYVDVLPERVNRVTGRIHTSFNQTGAATGRLSSSDPNLQNIPVRTARGEVIRRGFVPGPGRRLVVADYSQIELRLLADLSEDPVLIQAFRDGGDIHRQTASLLFGVPVDQVTPEMRARAKTINFGTIYGQGGFALSRMLGISLEEAKAFIAQYFERFAGVRAYLDRQIRIARDTGYVETKFGRRRYITEIHDKNFNLRAFAERTAQNTPLQGSAADLIKIAMVRIHGALQAEYPGAKLLLQVHDELVAEASIAEAAAVKDLMRRHMEGAAELKVPLLVDVGIGENWLDAKK